jgi:pyridoxine/pyridoxamine 5'-phosphate oxidase
MKQDLEKAIISYLDSHRHMALATVKDDGSPYCSIVSYVNKGLTIFFMTDPSSQKGKNIAFCPKVGVAISEDYLDWDKIEGVQLTGSVEWITDPAGLKEVQQMFAQKFPQVHKYLAGYGLTIDIIPFLRITAKSINFLDYSKGFNHWDTLAL